MSDKLYTMKTAALKATTADIRNVNAKQIKLNGTNIEDIIQSSSVNIEDGREVKSKYDIWEHAAVENEDGSVTVKNLYVPDASKWYEDHIEDFTFTYESWREETRVESRSCIDGKLYLSTDETTPIGSIDTSKIVNGDYLFATDFIIPDGPGWMIFKSSIGNFKFKGNLDNLKSGRYMFRLLNEPDEFKAPDLEFESDLRNLMDGTYMFGGGSSIDCEMVLSGINKPFDLHNLEYGDGMFDAVKISNDLIFVDMPKLKSASCMFYSIAPHEGTNIFDKNLDSLVMAPYMFCNEYSLHITRFSSDLPSLLYGDDMFNSYGGGGLSEFRGSLPALINGYCMFQKGELDAKSVVYIVNSIPDRTGLVNEDGSALERISGWFSHYDVKYPERGGFIDIGIACDNTEEDKQRYAEEGGWNSFQEILDEFSAKNWDVRFTFNGRPTTTYNMRRTTTEIIAPIWAKLEEVIIPTEEELKNMKRRIKPTYEYISADGSKFFNIQWYHTSNGNNDGYTQFNSLQEVVEYYGLKEKEITE